MKKQIQEVKDQIIVYEQKFATVSKEDSLFTGKAFIIFEEPIHVNVVLNMSKRTLLGKICRMIFCSCSSHHDFSEIIFEKAPEPTDVYWEHLGVTDFQKLRNTFITYLASLVLVGICFGIIYGLTTAKIEYVKSHKDDKSASNRMATNVLSVVVSLIITIINQLLRFVVRRFSLFE